MKTVLITGSSRGIGRETALYFASQGWNVIIHGFRHPEKLDSLKTEILSHSVSCLSFCGDISNPLFVDKMINISSIWGEAGASCEVLYSTTKGGINAFTKALAKEVAASNIQVNAIAFGMIDTEMNAEFDEEDLAMIKDEIPADYIASPKEAAQMVYHVAEAPGYMTGQIVTFSGGWY